MSRATVRSKGLAAAIAVLVALGVLAAAPAAQAAPSWSDGPIQRSYITNCPSVIFGNPYVEEGAWSWTGQYLDPANPPDVNEIFYVHVVAGAVGNSCSGQYVHFELLGPPVGTMYYDITPAHPVICWAINWNTNPPSAQQEPAYPAGACPQQPQTSGQFYGLGFDQQTGPSSSSPWPLPQGRGWEIQIPVYMNRTMSGGFGDCNDCNRFLSKLLDGNDSPQLFPRQGLFVSNTTPGGGGGGAPGTGGDDVGLQPAAQKPDPDPPATPRKKCKKGQKLKKGKCVKKKRKKKK